MFCRIKYLAINGHGRNIVLKEYYENGGWLFGKWVEAGDETFLTVPVILLDDKVTTAK